MDYRQSVENKQSNLERVMGIEPTFLAWEANVLPLNLATLAIATPLILSILATMQPQRMMNLD